MRFRAVDLPLVPPSRTLTCTRTLQRRELVLAATLGVAENLVSCMLANCCEMGQNCRDSRMTAEWRQKMRILGVLDSTKMQREGVEQHQEQIVEATGRSRVRPLHERFEL
jgi:hypothetical protein